MVVSAGLGGCGPSLPKLAACTSGKYRYANPNGVSLPSLDVPSPADLSGDGPAPGASPPPSLPSGVSRPAPAEPPLPPAPVATPPERGAMLLLPSSAIFASC